MAEHVIKLADRKVRFVVQRLNEVLDEERIFGSEWNEEVLLELIKDNLSRNATLDLIKRIEETPISEWND